MSALVTRDYVNQVQFFQMPKAFFKNPKYMGMKCESKLAYMLMLDLLSLSIKNNWVNGRGEVFVKLSRGKLMDLLNIGGSQKAALVMRELVDCKLIVDKKVGLSKCNEIYLYRLEDETTRPSVSPEVKVDVLPNVVSDAKADVLPNISSDSKANVPLNMTPPVKTHVSPKVITYLERPSAKKTSGQGTFLGPVDGSDESKRLEANLEEVQYLLASKIHLDDLRLQYNTKLVDEIGLSIRDMFLSASTAIGKDHKPRLIMQYFIRKLDIHHIEHVIHQYTEAAARIEIINPKKYLQTMIYNSLFETNTKVFGDIRYKFGYY